MDFQPISRGVPPNAHQADQAQGLTLFFRDVYAWMAGALALSGLVAYVVASSPMLLRAIYSSQLTMLAICLASFAVAMVFQRNAARMSTFAAGNLFFAYAALVGATLSSVLILYTGAAVTQAFFISSACFAGSAVYGSVTKRELSAAGQFLMVGLIGVLVASVVNIFLQSPAMQWVTSMAMVVVFAGFTAWDHQRLKNAYLFQGGAGNVALIGAFMLYLNFINLFLAILRLTGQRRDD